MTEDNELIELFFERSEQAIERLDNKYGRLFRKLSKSILGDERDAEECVSDAYLGVWNAIPPARPESLLPFVCRIVRNLSLKCYSMKSAAKRSSNYETAMDELEECIPSHETVEDEIDGRELTRIIESFLDTLSEVNSVIFMRRYWFSDSYEEIAKRIGISEKNVSVRLTRIRRQLKDYLSEREVFL